MSEQRKTCHDCAHLTSMDFGGTKMFSCDQRDALVPQHATPGEVTFWRVPMTCPLPDTEVLKSEKKAPHKDWVVVNLEDES